MTAITVTFTPQPTHVRIARMVAVASARRFGVDDDLIDEIRFAVGEACSRAVLINAASGTDVRMTMTEAPGSFAVEVYDDGHGAASTEQPDWDIETVVADLDPAQALNDPDPLPPDFGLAVISGMVEQVAVRHEESGTAVELRWPTDVDGGISAAN